MGGFILLFVPGLIVSLLLGQSMYVLFAENRRGISALTASWHYVKGYVNSVFWRFLFFGIVMLLIVIPFSFLNGPTTAMQFWNNHSDKLPLLMQFMMTVLLYLLLPLLIIYDFQIYTNLKELKAQTPIEIEEQSIRKKVITFSVLGIIGAILMAIFFGFLLIVFFAALVTGKMPDNGATNDFYIGSSTTQSLSSQQQIFLAAEQRLNLDMTQAALESYYLKNNEYPKTLSELGSYASSTRIIDPITNIQFTYQQLNNGQDYKLCAADDCMMSSGTH